MWKSDTDSKLHAFRSETEITGSGGGGRQVNVGKSVRVYGELTASEDLTVEGQVEGKIELRNHVLTIGPNGKIKAQVFAKSVIVLGEVTGYVTATEKVDIRDGGSVDADIVSPRVAIAEGADFRGSVDKPPSPNAEGTPISLHHGQHRFVALEGSFSAERLGTPGSRHRTASRT